jgi:hypothetical protein
MSYDQKLAETDYWNISLVWDWLVWIVKSKKLTSIRAWKYSLSEADFDWKN